MKTTYYFRRKVRRRHKEIKRHYDQIEQALTHPLRVEPDKKGRTKRWIYLEDVDKYLRVIVQPDGETVHNAFYDKDFKP